MNYEIGDSLYCDNTIPAEIIGIIPNPMDESIPQFYIISTDDNPELIVTPNQLSLFIDKTAVVEYVPNIRIIKTGINVNKILAQLEKYKDDWGNQSKSKYGESMTNYGFPKLDMGVLQLVMGSVPTLADYVGNTESCIKTPAYDRHTEIIGFLKRNFKSFSRCGFLALPVGGEVKQHIDIGSYYLTRDRYHLSIYGEYEYTVGGESVIVKPGTLLWFNNKVLHGTKNVGDTTRVTFVFDVPHSKNNP